MKIEICTNAEWLASGICNELDVDAWQDEVAAEYNDVAYRTARESGFEVESASGQRTMYHGWNGAHFDHRFGCFGVFGDLTAEQSAALEAADAAGYKAAYVAAEQFAQAASA